MFTPSIVPAADDAAYFVEDFGPKLGRVFRETHSTQVNRETTLGDLFSGQYSDPVRFVAFNTREGWSRDVSHEFAAEIHRRADVGLTRPAQSLWKFLLTPTFEKRK